ncbi:MAG: glutathione peroxidase [Pseudomonadota bacterium]
MRLATILFTLTAGLLLATGPAKADCDEGALLDQNFKRLASDDTEQLCEAYEDKVILVVNTASKCGNTPQYDGLEKLYQEYGERGLVVLGFPSNDFMGQEPGTEAEIQEFCRLTYGVQFPMFEKIVVKGDSAHPFYKALADEAGTEPGWNFHKYLIGRDGEFIATFSARTQPYDDSIVGAIEEALNADES